MSGTVHWFEAKPAPLVLVVGPESYLASKSIRTIREQLRQANPELEVSEIQEGTYTTQTRQVHTHIGSIDHMALDKIKAKFPKIK